MGIWKGVREPLAFWHVGGPTIGMRSHTFISGMNLKMWIGHVPSTKQALAHLPIQHGLWVYLYEDLSNMPMQVVTARSRSLLH